MKIVAIGGGEIGRPGTKIETKEIDMEIIRLTGKKNPKVLFLPTASEDSATYWIIFQKYYGIKLGCKTEVLYLIKSKETKKEIRNKILNSDIIYVGGGNTLRMLKIWRKKGVDKILEEAGKKGIILSGVSAGAICWFRYGNSDSKRFGANKSIEIIRLQGTGFIPIMACPHYDVEKTRRPSLKKMIKEKGGISIALENCTAIEVIDDLYRILSSKKSANAYRIHMLNGKVIEKKVPKDKKFRPLKELIDNF